MKPKSTYPRHPERSKGSPASEAAVVCTKTRRSRTVFGMTGVALLIVASLLAGFYVWHLNRDELHLKKTPYSQLPGWTAADTKQSLQAFLISCNTLLKQAPDTAVGSQYIPLTTQDWYPACRAARLVNVNSNKHTKAFFERWFQPVEFYNHKPVEGLFTGYYVPLLHGSLTKTIRDNIPVYGLPKNMITVDLSLFRSELQHKSISGRLKNNKLVPFYTREEINQGYISKTADVLAWVDSQIDLLFMEIQGSGIIQLRDGSHLVVGYAGQNGAPYTAIGRVLINQGVMTKENASMQRIRDYLESHPEQIETILNHNKSFVFFQKLPQKGVEGVQKIVLTPGYSLAVDRYWVPIGVPIWLNTTRPDPHSNQQKKLQRLMIAQDTGGAIRGMVRGDVFWGDGDRATEIAGKMKNRGYYWLLLPRGVVERLIGA